MFNIIYSPNVSNSCLIEFIYKHSTKLNSKQSVYWPLSGKGYIALGYCITGTCTVAYITNDAIVIEYLLKGTDNGNYLISFVGMGY